MAAKKNKKPASYLANVDRIANENSASAAKAQSAPQKTGSKR